MRRVCFLSEKATKYCGEDGQWFRHPDTNRTWSNYTLCNENTKAKLKVGRRSVNSSFSHHDSLRWFKMHKSREAVTEKDPLSYFGGNPGELMVQFKISSANSVA